MITGIIVWSACSGKEEDIEPEVSVSVSTLTFEANETEEKEITIFTNAESWLAEAGASWIMTSKKADKTKLGITVKEHTDTDNPREAVVTVTASIKSKTSFTNLKIIQNKKPKNTLTISPFTLTFGANDTGKKSVNVTTNATSWAFSDPKVNWIQLTKQGNQLEVNVTTRNTQTTERSADISITAGNADEITLKVIQDRKDALSVDPSSLTFESDDKSKKSIEVTTNIPDWSATSESSWLTLEKKNNTLTVAAARNTTARERTGTIRFTAGSADSKDVLVTQNAEYINVSPSLLTFESNDVSKKTIDVTTNVSEWSATVMSGSSWLTLEKKNNTLTVSVSKNTTPQKRTGTIKFTAGTADSKEVTVTQNADFLSIAPNMLSFESDDANQKNVDVNTNVSNWSATVTSGTAWVSFEKHSNSITVKAARNTTKNQRTGTIRIRAGAAESQDVSITQSADDLVINATTMTFDFDETNQKTVTITTKVSQWDASTTASWLTLTKSDKTLRINPALPNPNTTDRTATVTVTAGYAQPCTLTVTQSGKPVDITLSVSPSIVNYAWNSTTVQNVTVTTNAVSWTATKDASASWLTISTSGNLLKVNPTALNASNSSRTADVTVTAGNLSRTVRVNQSGVSWPVRSNYSATGSPLEDNPPYNITSWSGVFEPNTTTSQPTYYTFSRWFNSGRTIRFHYNGSQFSIDRTTKVLDDVNVIYSGYLVWGTYNAGTKTLMFYLDDDRIISYNTSTKTFDAGTYNGLPVFLAIIPKNIITGEWRIGSYYFNLFYNVKMSLTTTYSSPETRSSDIETDKVEYKTFPKDFNVIMADPKR